MSDNQTAIPPGYWRNAQGGLTPEAMIKPIDRARDDLVREIVQAAEKLSETIGTFKAKAFADVAAFVDLSAEQYGVALGGRKGNVTLMSFDGSLKVVRAISESITFDERLQAAKALIDECFLDWTSTARPEVKALIDRAFEVDREGNIRTGAVLSLRRVDIQDERWVRAMQAINDAVQVVGSKAYIRVYKRIGDTEKWEPLALDVAGV
jgi:hypothetical protein